MKELFNQTTTATPDDNDRIGLGQPSVPGGKNMLWSAVKTFLQTAIRKIVDTDGDTIVGTEKTNDADFGYVKVPHTNKTTAFSVYDGNDAVSFSVDDYGNIYGNEKRTSYTSNTILILYGSAAASDFKIARGLAEGRITMSLGSGCDIYRFDATTTYIQSMSNLRLNPTTRVTIDSPRLAFTGITEATRDALTPVAGDIIYNTTANKHQGYDGSAWNNLY